MGAKPVVAGLILPVLLAACASGGGSGATPTPAPTPAPTATPAPTPSPTPTPAPTPTLTIEAAAMATVGSSPPTTPAEGFQQATPGGPIFPSTYAAGAGPAGGTVFAVTQSTLGLNSTLIAPDTVTNAQGASLVVVDATTNKYELRIPNLKIDVDVTLSTGATPAPDTQLSTGAYLNITPLTLAPDPSNPFKYVLFDQYVVKDSADNLITNTGWQMFGFQTPASSLPTIGGGYWSGTVLGQAFVDNAPNFPSGHAEQVYGYGSLSVNFVTGAVAGGFSDMQYKRYDTPSAWPEVSISGTLSAAEFTGSTSAATALPDSSSGSAATGTIAGGLYGPSASELGAIWTLADGKSSAVGVFGGQLAGPATIAAFAEASVGSSPSTTPAGGYEEAAAGGPTLADVPSSTEFALNQSVVYISTTGSATTVAADTATMGGGAVLTALNSINDIHLVIPTLHIDAIVQVGSGQGLSNNGDLTGIANYQVMQYTALGRWANVSTPAGTPSGIGWFVFGYQTPVASVPVSGYATYNGQVQGEVFTPSVSATPALPYTNASLAGNAALNVNFATGAITGALSGMQVTPAAASAPVGTWNDVSLSATISGATFAGSTSATSSPTGAAGAPYVLAGTATGTIKGAFYGPAADEAGAIWTLSDGQRSAIGSIGATKAPSDRRLKRDIAPVGRLANGLRLYRYRYIGDARVFVGIMAQDLIYQAPLRDAAVRGPDGFYWVDYGRLGLVPPDIRQMREAGLRAIAVCRRRRACYH